MLEKILARFHAPESGGYRMDFRNLLRWPYVFVMAPEGVDELGATAGLPVAREPLPRFDSAKGETPSYEKTPGRMLREHPAHTLTIRVTPDGNLIEPALADGNPEANHWDPLPSRLREEGFDADFVAPYEEEEDFSERGNLRTQNLAWRAMVAAVVVMLFLNSEGLVKLARDLPSWPPVAGDDPLDRLRNGYNAGIRTAYALSQSWHEQMETLGFTAPRTLVFETFQKWRAASWQDLAGSPGEDTPGEHTPAQEALGAPAGGNAPGAGQKAPPPPPHEPDNVIPELRH